MLHYTQQATGFIKPLYQISRETKSVYCNYQEKENAQEKDFAILASSSYLFRMHMRNMSYVNLFPQEIRNRLPS